MRENEGAPHQVALAGAGLPTREETTFGQTEGKHRDVERNGRGNDEASVAQEVLRVGLEVEDAVAQPFPKSLDELADGEEAVGDRQALDEALEDAGEISRGGEIEG